MIILTSEEASKVCGISPLASWAAIEPAPLKDGTFMLHEDVLADPVHADVKEFLEGLPQEEIKAGDGYIKGDVVPAYPTWKDAGVRKPMSKEPTVIAASKEKT